MAKRGGNGCSIFFWPSFRVVRLRLLEDVPSGRPWFIESYVTGAHRDGPRKEWTGGRMSILERRDIANDKCDTAQSSDCGELHGPA